MAVNYIEQHLFGLFKNHIFLGYWKILLVRAISTFAVIFQKKFFSLLQKPLTNMMVADIKILDFFPGMQPCSIKSHQRFFHLTNVGCL